MIDKIFFNPGDLVIVRHEEIVFRPVMVVSKVLKYPIKDSLVLGGVTCWWFIESGEYVEATFNTKDLEHYKAK